MTMLQHASFNGTQLDIIDHNGQRWLTAEQVGLALGYNEANARDGIIKLYNRNKDEFQDLDTCTVKLAVQGQQREMRVFSASGCNLLSFFSNTKRAKQFRAWAKQALLVEQQVNTQALSDLNAKLKDKLMQQHLRYRQVYQYLERGFTTLEIARCMQLSSRMIRNIQEQMRELELLPEQQVFEFAHTGRISRTSPQLKLEV